MHSTFTFLSGTLCLFMQSLNFEMLPSKNLITGERNRIVLFRKFDHSVLLQTILNINMYIRCR